MKSRLLDRLLLPARVHTVSQWAPRLRHVTLTGPMLAGLAWLPGQHVRLQVGAAPGAVDWLIGTRAELRDTQDRLQCLTRVQLEVMARLAPQHAEEPTGVVRRAAPSKRHGVHGFRSPFW